jgi:ubiquinone/menaquinone biosynthesis C-methylase UbiE
LRVHVSGWKHKRSVKLRYDATARIYDERYAEEQEAKYLAALADVKPTGLVLDVGCGTGLSLKHVASEAVDVVGVDISKKLLQQARHQAEALGNVGLVQADADNLPFKDNQFNAVFAFTVLQNMPYPLKTLLEAKRIARGSAFIVVTGLKKVFSSKRLENLLQEAGLQVASVKNDEKLACYVASCFKKA